MALESTFELEREYARRILAHALEMDPVECCGVIAGKDGRATKLFKAKNAEDSPFRYEIDSNELFQIHRELLKEDWDILAIYHSHTGTKAFPSPTDVRAAMYPDATYLIVSLRYMARPLLQAFRIVDEKVQKVTLHVSPVDSSVRRMVEETIDG